MEKKTLESVKNFMEKMSGRYESVNYSCIVEFKKMQVLDFETDFSE